MKLTRQEAIEKVGLDNVIAVEKINCDFTNSVRSDDLVEFASTIKINEPNIQLLIAYYYQERENIKNIENLSELNWEISHYSVI